MPKRRGGTAAYPNLSEQKRREAEAFLLIGEKPLTYSEIKKLGYDFWKKQKSIDHGHFDNLVYDDGKHRVWISRQSVADYDGDRKAWLAERMTIEHRSSNGNWVKA